MRHRIIDFFTGLGNSSPCKLDNEWKGNQELQSQIRECLEDGIETFNCLKELGGCDFKIIIDKDNKLECVSFGFEPAYIYEHLFIINIDLVNKEDSYIYTGYSRGVYGSKICSTLKQYKEYKRKSKFTRFIDKWYEKFLKFTSKEQV